MIDSDNDKEITIYDLIESISPDIDDKQSIIRGLTTNVNEVITTQQFISVLTNH